MELSSHLQLPDEGNIGIIHDDITWLDTLQGPQQSHRIRGAMQWDQLGQRWLHQTHIIISDIIVSLVCFLDKKQENKP